MADGGAGGTPIWAVVAWVMVVGGLIGAVVARAMGRTDRMRLGVAMAMVGLGVLLAWTYLVDPGSAV